ncbi:MAG: transporter ATP-binding protein [Flaviaesturariibacter sp.]|nr:transporter ATP-binding protein [Flaviaesturariibacter sp.]
MKIELTRAGKRFNYDWIFRNLTLQFSSGTSYAITGPNGSGKSTLLGCIGGLLQPSEGVIAFSRNDAEIDAGQTFRLISLCAPYLDVIEEMTLTEFFGFHQSFKPFLAGTTTDGIIDSIGLGGAREKQIRYFSSGMKQRVKLAQAVFSDTPVLLLDEPCSNLDTDGIALYQSLIERYAGDRIIIVCSNDPVEYRFCTTVLSMDSIKARTA